MANPINDDSLKPAPGNDATGWLSRLDRISKIAENTLLMVVLASMVGVAVWQIFARNVFSGGFYWADEYLRLTVLWIALIGSIAAIGEDLGPRLVAGPWPAPRGRAGPPPGVLYISCIYFHIFSEIAIKLASHLYTIGINCAQCLPLAFQVR